MISRRHFLRDMLGVVAGAGLVGLPVWEWMAERGRVDRFTRTLMGTDVQIVLVGLEPDVAAAAASRVFAEMETVASRFTIFDPTSTLNVVNASAGPNPVPVPTDLGDVLARAITIRDQTEGAFTPTIAPLSRLWSQTGEVPDPETVEAAAEAVQASRLRIPAPGWVQAHATPNLDLGGIAKGFAVDRAVAALRRMGVTNAVVDAGGDLRVLGSRAGEPWKVGVPDPSRPQRIAQVLELTDAAVATSGDYQRFFVVDGVRYHHIVDPRTGYPADRSRSFTVVLTDGMSADAASTAGFVLGTAGLDFVVGLDGRAITMDRSGRWWATPGLDLTAV